MASEYLYGRIIELNLNLCFNTIESARIMSIDLLFATPDNAVVEYRTMELELLSKIHYYLKHPVLGSTSSRTLKEFMSSLPRKHSFRLFEYSDWIFWKGLLLHIGESNPSIPRIEFHFSYTYGEVSTVFTLAYDGGKLWFNKYNNKSVKTCFYSINRGCFRKPIDPDSSYSKVFDIKKYRKTQQTILFDEMTDLETIIGAERDRINEEAIIATFIANGI
jgi:hypothetical protein